MLPTRDANGCMGMTMSKRNGGRNDQVRHKQQSNADRLNRLALPRCLVGPRAFRCQARRPLQSVRRWGAPGSPAASTKIMYR